MWPALEAARRRHIAMLWQVKGFVPGVALGPRGMPFQLALVVETRPETGWQLTVDVFDIAEGEIGLQDRRPGRALDLANLLAVLASVNKGFTHGLVAVDEEFHEPPLDRPPGFRQQGLAAGEMP